MRRFVVDEDSSIAPYAELRAASHADSADSRHGDHRQLRQSTEQLLSAAAHGDDLRAMRAGLSPRARDAIDRHEAEIRGVIERVVAAGTESGTFHPAGDTTVAVAMVHAMLTGAATLPDRSPEMIEGVTRMILAALDAHDR